MIRFDLKKKGITEEYLGLIPLFLSPGDPRPARVQFNENYAHGGGWRPRPEFKVLPNLNIKYPGDTPLKLWAEGKLRDETIRIYDCGYVSITQPDGSFEVSRMD